VVRVRSRSSRLLPRGNEAGFEQAKLQELGDPFRILLVRFVARNPFQLFSIDHHDRIKQSFHHVPGRLEVTPPLTPWRRRAVRLLQPVDTRKQFPCHRGEAANLLVLMARFIHDEQTRHEELFVDIDATTRLIQDLHNLSSL